MNRCAESVCRARFSACGQSIQDHGAERGQECADSDREMFGEPKNVPILNVSAHALKGAEACGSKPTCFGLDWPSSGRVSRPRGLQGSRVTRSAVGN